MQKNTVAENYLNAIEHEPVLTRVLNPKASGVQGRRGAKLPAKKIPKYFFVFFFKKKNVFKIKKNVFQTF